ncbi:uncharacterized protein [Lepeophtheirus salmonis]|uniref:uncharacterized protein n=1 Tax=Lepeophtheirus salmonis TaxID=72036 RepID=UPI001AE27611|nr:uncharacterized protein LOC121118606 [Lepeophtheirus salmonis]
MTKVTPTDHEANIENTSSPRRKSTVKDDDQTSTNPQNSHNTYNSKDPNSKNRSCGSSLQAGFCQINPVTKTGQRLYMVHMLLLPFLPISALIIQNAIGLSDLLRYQAEVQRSGAKVDGATHIEKFITNMQRERSEVAFYIFTYGKQTLGFNLSERFQITDEALEKMPWPEMKVSKSNENMFKSKLRFQIRHGDFRQRISQEEEDINSILNWYNRADAVFLQHLSTGIKTTNSSAVWRYLIAYANLLRCIENYGIAVAYGIRYYGQGRITRDNYIQFIRHFTLGDEYLDQSKNYVPTVKQESSTIKTQGDHYNALEKSRRDVLEQRPQKPNTNEALRFYQATYGYTEALRVVIKDLREEIKRIVEEELTSANHQQALGVAVLIIVLIISPTIIFLVRNATATIQIFSFSLSKKAFELKMERKKADDLLFQMLPKEVASTIQSKKRSMPEKMESVSVLYSDIQDFTSMVQTSSPIEIVILLNSLYKMFDSRIDKYDVYKVNNINDSYMIVSGIPSKPGKMASSEYPAYELSTLAIDLIGGSSMFVIPHSPKERLLVRIGIHSGPAIGGVLTVRNKMPRYRLFGDSVYVAHQLNIQCEPMKIHISLECKLLLDSLGGFRTEHRGMMNIKPKGMVDTYWLMGKEGGILNKNNRDGDYSMDEGPDYMKDLSNADF